MTLDGPSLGDDWDRWTWRADESERTVLVAAGLPAGARRPSGRGRVRGDFLGPWLTVLRRAPVGEVMSALGGALADLRAAVEGGAATTPPGVDPLVFARWLGEEVGARLGSRGGPSRADVVAVVEAFTGRDQVPAVVVRVRAALGAVVAKAGRA
ncbi:hypothetical protein [Saccharothrix sp. S26]|uniref:hypothetical protein n=1 Tax=Saccharothrix sp. S26 TaxID=2907215 RepID=UPI002279C8CC|nr:hypothetical protein [Saccharothrix sp. S26]